MGVLLTVYGMGVGCVVGSMLVGAGWGKWEDGVRRRTGDKASGATSRRSGELITGRRALFSTNRCAKEFVANSLLCLVT